jgi:hypothetical protein
MLNPYFDEIPDSSNKVLYNNIESVQIVTDVATEPVTLVEAKSHLRVDFTDEDTYITRLTKVAREQIEEQLNKALASKTIKVGLLNQKGNIKLPYWTHNAGTLSITDRDAVTISSSAYKVVEGVLETSFPELVYVTYTTGYATLPSQYEQMILERIAYLYNHRGDQTKNNGGVWLL